MKVKWGFKFHFQTWMVYRIHKPQVPTWNQNHNIISESEKEWKCFQTHTHNFVESAYGTDTQQNLKDGLISVTYELNWIYTASEDVKLWAGKLVACVISALYSKWPNLERSGKQRKSPSRHIFESRGTSELKRFSYFHIRSDVCVPPHQWSAFIQIFKGIFCLF